MRGELHLQSFDGASKDDYCNVVYLFTTAPLSEEFCSYCEWHLTIIPELVPSRTTCEAEDFEIDSITLAMSDPEDFSLSYLHGEGWQDGFLDYMYYAYGYDQFLDEGLPAADVSWWRTDEEGWSSRDATRFKMQWGRGRSEFVPTIGWQYQGMWVYAYGEIY
jgi:hypothetical protein